ncbi:hypothetical protein IAU60_005802 [Kwoniella sp. DSM 27419]
MFVVNQTYMQVNVTSNNQCTLPILRQKSFFATQTFSVGPLPTIKPPPRSPTSAYTVFAEVSTASPGTLPIDPHHATHGEKLAIALGVTGGVLGLALILLVMWWVRKKRVMERETLAFSRLSQRHQQAFLRDNPDSFLNPYHPHYAAQKRQAYAHPQEAYADPRYLPRGPPIPPPGTMAHAMWWTQQMWNDQMRQQSLPSSTHHPLPPLGYQPSASWTGRATGMGDVGEKALPNPPVVYAHGSRHSRRAE